MAKKAKTKTEKKTVRPKPKVKRLLTQAELLAKRTRVLPKAEDGAHLKSVEMGDTLDPEDVQMLDLPCVPCQMTGKVKVKGSRSKTMCPACLGIGQVLTPLGEWIMYNRNPILETMEVHWDVTDPKEQIRKVDAAAEANRVKAQERLAAAKAKKEKVKS